MSELARKDQHALNYIKLNKLIRINWEKFIRIKLRSERFIFSYFSFACNFASFVRFMAFSSFITEAGFYAMSDNYNKIENYLFVFCNPMLLSTFFKTLRLKYKKKILKSVFGLTLSIFYFVNKR
jgi:hypothetical protein